MNKFSEPVNNQQATQFGLIRHAATLWNNQKKIQGQLDSPLSPAGREQAAAWGKELSGFSWQRILCSDLGRARETAALINEALNLPVMVEPKLREQDWGQWSGMTLAELRNSAPGLLLRQVRSGWNFRPPGGESRQEVLERCLPVLQEAGTSYPGERILVVCHEGVIKCLLYHLLGRRFLPEEPKKIQGFHLHLLECRDRKLYLAHMNRLALHRAS
ncbi:MAG: histidine phosphatase family protein [Desulfobulbaceae bacterium]|nr:histidine phosphatase family protein [Desulfobulbaceae bacterium]